MTEKRLYIVTYNYLFYWIVRSKDQNSTKCGMIEPGYAMNITIVTLVLRKSDVPR